MPLDRSSISDEGRRALEDQENDPRRNAEQIGPLDVFLAAVDEAELACRLMEGGAEYMVRCLEIEELTNGPVTVDHHREAFEYREEMARIDTQAGHPVVFGMALVATHGALDHFVESMAPLTFRIASMGTGLAYIEREVPAERQPEFRKLLEKMFEIPETRELIEDAIGKATKKIGRAGKNGGKGEQRYSHILDSIGLGRIDDRPFPADLDETLAEAGALRDVLVHKSGLIDAQALNKAPTLERRYSVGELVRIGHADYGLYASAIQSFAFEVITRSRLRSQLPVDFDIERWRLQRPINF